MIWLGLSSIDFIYVSASSMSAPLSVRELIPILRVIRDALSSGLSPYRPSLLRRVVLPKELVRLTATLRFLWASALTPDLVEVYTFHII